MLSSDEVKKILQQTVGEDFVSTMADCPMEDASPAKQTCPKSETSGMTTGAVLNPTEVN